VQEPPTRAFARLVVIGRATGLQDLSLMLTASPLGVEAFP
jgi:hypothetical protein